MECERLGTRLTPVVVVVDEVNNCGMNVVDLEILSAETFLEAMTAMGRVTRRLAAFIIFWLRSKVNS